MQFRKSTHFYENFRIVLELHCSKQIFERIFLLTKCTTNFLKHFQICILEYKVLKCQNSILGLSFSFLKLTNFSNFLKMKVLQTCFLPNIASYQFLKLTESTTIFCTFKCLENCFVLRIRPFKLKKKSNRTLTIY